VVRERRIIKKDSIKRVNIMEIKKFQVGNVGRFCSLEIPLAPTDEKLSNVTVFVGNNGAGKTSLLISLAISLSWFVARLRSEKGSGSPIPDGYIKNDTSSASIDIEVAEGQGPGYEPHGAAVFEWTLARTKKGRKSDIVSSLSTVTRLADYYRAKLTAEPKSSLPLIAYYSVERGVLDIPLKIKGKHTFEQLDGYANSLTQGVDFRCFFEWFREREDTENETGFSQELLEKVAAILDQGPETWKKLSELEASARDRQLTAVRTAISVFMPGFKNLRIRRKPRLHMSIDKAGETLNVAQLSQGEKSLMALVGDISRRLAMMNPALENPLHGDGIILIDEVDLHLHPKWQRSLIDRLVRTFPNCQFVLTTHSPLVISDTKDVLCYLLDDSELTEMSDLYGLDANQVLLKVMDTDIRNAEINSKLFDLLEKIQDGKLPEAQSLFSELANELPEGHIELMKARLLIRKLELRHAKDQ
jgi:predicted ATP-binding protein involved in virulence